MADIISALKAKASLPSLERLRGPQRCLGCGLEVPRKAEPPPDIERPSIFGPSIEECRPYLDFQWQETERIHDMGWHHLILKRGNFDSTGGWVCGDCWHGSPEETA